MLVHDMMRTTLQSNESRAFYLITSDFSYIQNKSIEMQQYYGVHDVDKLALIQDEKILIDDIRKIKTFLSQKPFSSKNKLVILNGDALTEEAQQALLKTLEEPSSQSIIILFISHVDKLLPTIMSRLFPINEPNKDMAKTISNDTSSSTLQYWEDVLTATASTRLEMSNIISKEKDRMQLSDWLKTQVLELRQVLLNRDDDTNHLGISVNLTFLIRQVIKTRELVKNNCNTKLALDWLFLSIT